MASAGSIATLTMARAGPEAYADRSLVLLALRRRPPWHVAACMLAPAAEVILHLTSPRCAPLAACSEPTGCAGFSPTAWVGLVLYGCCFDTTLLQLLVLCPPSFALRVLHCNSTGSVLVLHTSTVVHYSTSVPERGLCEFSDRLKMGPLDHFRPNSVEFGRMWPTLAELSPNLSLLGPNLDRFRPTPLNSGQTRPCPGDDGHILDRL